MNDVSILYPLPKTESELGALLGAATPGRGGPLLPQSLYEGAPTPPTPELAYAGLRVVALRLDPCFAQIGPVTDPGSCKPQLRVILQSITFANGASTAADSAVHAFFALTSAELASAVGEVVALRASIGGAQDLGPLAVHPLLASQGIGGPMGQGLAAIVAKYAGASNLARFTLLRAAGVLGPTAPGGENRFWNFQGFDVVAGALSQMVIPGLLAGSTQVGLSGATKPLALQFSTPPTTPDDLRLMLSASAFDGASATDRQTAYDAALRIENPSVSSPDTIDCASCHASRPARDLVAAPLGLTPVGDPNAYAADPRYVPAADTAITTTVTAAALNVHAFSYRDAQPMINARVINETAAIVATLSAPPTP